MIHALPIDIDDHNIEAAIIKLKIAPVEKRRSAPRFCIGFYEYAIFTGKQRYVPLSVVAELAVFFQTLFYFVERHAETDAAVAAGQRFLRAQSKEGYKKEQRSCDRFFHRKLRVTRPATRCCFACGKRPPV